MPTINVNDITFHYTDSGLPVDKEEYSTLFVIHGHTFHSEIFRPLFPVAGAHSLRIICIDRREYQGSTPYTTDELSVINEGTDAERLELLTLEGVYLALGIESLIRELHLPVRGGGALAGWSLGNVFSLAVINAISHLSLPEGVKTTLKVFIRTFIILDPPFQVLGLSSPTEDYSPLWDNDIPEAERGAAFASWISSYFIHDADKLGYRDPSKLNQRNPSSKTPTTVKMTTEELLSVTDFLPGPKCDTAFGGHGPAYHSALRLNFQNALFDADPNINKWNFRSVVHLYGVESAWSIIYAVWALEEKDRASKRIKFRPIEGANHFMMWDEPEVTVAVLKECMAGV